MNRSAPSEQSLLAEYAAANSVYLAYDGYRWQSGSFLIAGVFVYWGFLISASAPSLVTTVSTTLVAGLMSCWMLFANHYRQLYLLKLLRLQEIERALGMEQHRRFMEATLTPFGVQRAEGPRGHNIDFAVYVITSLGGIAIVWARSGFSAMDLLAVPLVAFIIAYVSRNERRTAAKIARWRDSLGRID